jgi:hypothetical protein
MLVRQNWRRNDRDRFVSNAKNAPGQKPRSVLLGEAVIGGPHPAIDGKSRPSGGIRSVAALTLRVFASMSSLIARKACDCVMILFYAGWELVPIIWRIGDAQDIAGRNDTASFHDQRSASG